MNLQTGVSLGQLLFGFVSILFVSGIAWGGLLQRVRTLEREVKALSGFSDLLSRIDERTKNIKEDVSAIKRSWVMADPPGYDAIKRPKGAT
jgi:hypothetical protein